MPIPMEYPMTATISACRRIIPVMRQFVTPIAFNAPLPIDELKDRLCGAQAKEFLSHAQHDLFSVVRKHFEDDRIRTLFTSYMHVITTESVPGAGKIALPHFGPGHDSALRLAIHDP